MLKSWMRAVFSIGWVSFREIIRDKILYNILVVTVLLLGVGFLASRMTFVRPDRVVLDFGVTAVALSLVAIAALIGASLLNRELERRTMYLALSRPISRVQFVIGKFAGLCGVLFVNWLLVSASFCLVLELSGGASAGDFTATLWLGLVLLLLQSFMMAAVAVFFSSFSTTSLSAVLAAGVFLIGNNVSQIQGILSKIRSVPVSACLQIISFAVPNFEYFNLGTRITYGLAVPARLGFVSLGYCLVVSALSVVAAGALIRGKEA